jgi:hypothetical protein
MLRLRCSVPVFLILALAGCGQRLDYESTVQLDAGEVQSLGVDPPRREQRVSVTVTSTSVPVDVYVVLEKDKESGKQALLDVKKPAESLASKTKTQQATLEATIPAKTGFAILLGGATKSSQVKVKVIGR